MQTLFRRRQAVGVSSSPLNHGLLFWQLAVPGRHGWGTKQIIDIGRQSLTGTLTNAAADVWSGYGIGTLGSLKLDGTNDYITYGDVLNLTGSAITVAAVVRPGAASQTKGIAGRDNGTAATQYTLIQSGTQYEWRTSTTGGNGSIVTAASTTDITQYQYLTGTYDGITMRIYLNGTQRSSAARTGTLTTRAVNFEVGSRNGGTIPYNGHIESVRVYDRALLPAEVYHLYVADMNGHVGLLDLPQPEMWMSEAAGSPAVTSGNLLLLGVG